jgi:hypothetical protein
MQVQKSSWRKPSIEDCGYEKKPILFISTQPSDADTRDGWRQPRTCLGRGIIPQIDECQRFRVHPWYKEASRLTRRLISRALLMWLGVAALLMFYQLGSPSLPRKFGTVAWIIAIAITGLCALPLMFTAIVNMVSGLINAKGTDHVLRRYLRNSTHEEAVACLRRYLSEGQPYAVYFRNFHLEADTIVLPNKTSLTCMRPPLAFERRLADALEGKLQIIALDNPANIMRFERPAIPRLCVPVDTWLDWLQDLIWAASLVVIYCDAITEGVTQELKLLELLKQSNNTIVIVPPDSNSVSLLGSLRSSLAELSGAKVNDMVPITKEAECLKSFPYVSYEDELDFNQLEKTRGFCEILPEVHSWGIELRRRLSGPSQVFLNLIPFDMTNLGEIGELDKQQLIERGGRQSERTRR